MRKLAADLGNPERDLRFIHIAGTNGKGSVAAMCAAIATAAGLKSGLYTSPHLVSYRERFQLDGEQIAESRLEQYLEWFESRGWPATFFEISTALALLYFRDERADLIAWETGLGGRLDATNIVTPCVSVITGIGLDHTQLLGDTLEKIAAEKAGIIKPGIPVVTACADRGALEVISARAGICGSPLRRIGADDLREFESPLRGAHQQWNTALAVAAMRIALPALSDDAIRNGLARVRWPGRAEWLDTDPPLLVDGAHNPDAIRALVPAAAECFAGRPFWLVFGAAQDKDIESMAEMLRSLPGLESVILVPLPHERSASMETLSRLFPGAATAQCWAEAWERVRQAGVPALVTGSLFLVAEVLRHFDPHGAGIDAGEHFLFKI